MEAGLTKLEKYARMFGLGDKSGLEISEYEPRISDTDAVRSAIGQGTNSYSLSHIARYVATLANRGNCYDLTLLDKLTETDGTLIQEYEPALHNQVQIADSSWNAVQQGMRLVAENTKSLSVLSDLGLNVAGQDRYGAAEQEPSEPCVVCGLCAL